jgi:uncharacterized Ntn-hydrolase superfamily protein
MKRSILIPLFLISGTIFFCVVKSQRSESIRCHTADVLTATFSITGFDPQTGDLGVAVQSKFPNVRAVVPWAEAGVGAVATQALSNASYGPKGLVLMRNGATADEALKILIENDSLRDERQAGIVDAKGNSATWTGRNTFDWAGGDAGGNWAGRGEVVKGKLFTAQGNILVGKETIEAMAKVFEETEGSLADRLVAALVAGGKAGGDRRGEQSAALLVVRKGAGYQGALDNFVDISIYDHPHPLQELQRLYEMHKLYFFKTDPKNLVKIDQGLCRELQQIMKDRGFYKGDLTGVVDEGTKKNLQDFMYWENYDERVRNDDQIDKEVLQDIRKNYEEWKKMKKQGPS